MFVSTLDRGRDAVNVRPPDTERTLSMLNQSTTFGDPRLPRRFWQKVRVLDNGCWEWTAARTTGYGSFRVGSLTDGTRRQTPAHRWAYEHLVGPIHEGLECDHLCHNGTGCPGGSSCPHRACVNPAHIEPVTHRVNLLRGNTLPAKEAKTTHCPKGHPYDEANTCHRSRGSRECRTCRNAAKRLARQGIV